MRGLFFSLPALCLALMAQPSVAQPLVGTLARIAETGKVVIGYRAAEPPFSFEGANGEIIGFSIDLCQKIVERIGETLGRDNLEVEYLVATPATRFILVKSGTVDLECAATTNNAERRETVDFSYPHFMTATHFVSRRADNIGSVEDLAGRSVTSASGTVNIDQLNALNREKQLNIAVMPTKSNEDAFDLVVTGRASAFVMDGILLAAMIASTPEPSDYVLSTDTLSPPEPYGLMLQRNDPAFKTLVDETLREVFTSGEIDAIYAKWFTSPIPPNGSNLNLPMSPDLQQAFANPEEYTK